MSSELEQLRARVAELEDVVRSAADGDTGPAMRYAGLEDEPCGKLSDLKGAPTEEEREVAIAKMFDDWCGGEEPVLFEEECAEAFSRWFRSLTNWPPPKLAFASGWAAHQQRGIRTIRGPLSDGG